MAWGAKSDLLLKAQSSSSLCVMPFRKFGAEECAQLCLSLHSNSTLTELLASGHDVGEEGARALGLLLAQPECGLRRLAIGHNGWGAEGLSALLHGLGDASCRLVDLDLSYKGLDASAAPSLATLLARCVELERLSLSRNRLDHSLQASSLPSSLVDLELRDVSLAQETLASLEAAIPFNGRDDDENEPPLHLASLRRLDLSENALTSEGCASVAHLLRASRIEKLKLHGCSIQAHDVNSLIAAARLRKENGAPLHELDLSLNPMLGDCQDIGILVQCGMSALDLSDCDISTPAAVALASALAAQGDDSSLRSLRLRSNQIHAHGCAALLSCSTLEHLALFNNPLGSECSEADAGDVVSSLSKSPQLRTLDLGGCQLAEALVLKLLDSLGLGGAPKLELIEIMGSSCPPDLMRGALDSVKQLRPELDIAWKGDRTTNET